MSRQVVMSRQLVVMAKNLTNSCESCPLHDLGQLHPDMPTSGDGELGIMFVGEAPGRDEDQQGIQFVGDAGQTLRGALSTLGYHLGEDFWKTNALRCRPPQNREPTKKEIKFCRPKLLASIEKRKPKMIIALGKSALISLIGEFITDITITRFRGLIIPIPEYDCYLASTMHPSFINRLKAPDNDFAYSTFKRDLTDAINFAKHIK